MKHSIEMRFDEQAELAIRSIWQKAAILYGSQYVLQNGLIPHVALLVGDQGLEEIFSKAECPSIEIRLSQVGFFARGDVAYLQCPEVAGLFEFQKQLYARAVSVGAAVDELYTPDNWVPHCTIAQQCEKNKERNIEFDPIEARVRSLIHVTHPPTMLVAEKTIQQTSSPMPL